MVWNILSYGPNNTFLPFFSFGSKNFAGARLEEAQAPKFGSEIIKKFIAFFKKFLGG